MIMSWVLCLIPLGAYEENLVLTGFLEIDGAGNELDNVINGNDASNVLTGGAGADLFILDGRDEVNLDTISDYNPVDDTIGLDVTIFVDLELGNLSDAEFYIGTQAHDADDRVIYNSSTGVLYYDADGTGSATAVEIAILGTITHPSLTANDFVVI